MSEPSITVTFTEHEARALRNSCAFVGEVFAGIFTVPVDVDDGVNPLDSAAMRLEVALVCAGAEL